jgi:hypothetical protein
LSTANRLLESLVENAADDYMGEWQQQPDGSIKQEFTSDVYGAEVGFAYTLSAKTASASSGATRFVLKMDLDLTHVDAAERPGCQAELLSSALPVLMTVVGPTVSQFGKYTASNPDAGGAALA